MKLRLATPEDMAVLAAMVTDLSRYHDPDCAPPDGAGLHGLLWGDRALGTAFILEADGPVGYAIMSEFGRFHAGTRALELVHLHVARDRRGAGIGAEFMTLLENWARAQGHDRIVLTAGTDRAQSFYDKIGYEKIDAAQRYRRVFA